MKREGPSKLGQQVDRFIEAALVPGHAHRSGTVEQARNLLAQEPKVATASIYSAVTVGELDAVRAFVRSDPEAANRRGGPRGWEPLLYLCFSRYLRLDPERAERMVQAAELLLQCGADPDAYWTDPNEAEGSRETPIYGAAGVANNPRLTALLLEAGADPNDGETPYLDIVEYLQQAAERLDLRDAAPGG